MIPIKGRVCGIFTSILNKFASGECFSTQRGRIPPEQVELVCFLQYQVQRKCICEGSILNIKATNLLFIVRELKFSQSKPFSGCLMDLTSVMKEDHVSKQISPSQEGTIQTNFIVQDVCRV